MSSGEHSLAGAEIAGTTLFSGKGSPPVRGFPCRRRRSTKSITSDHGGFAGVRLPGNRCPPANILSPEVASWHHHYFRRALAPSEQARKKNKHTPVSEVCLLYSINLYTFSFAKAMTSSRRSLWLKPSSDSTNLRTSCRS